MESNSKIKFLGALLIVLLAAVSFSCMVSASDINTSNITQLNNNTQTDSISGNEVNTGNVTNNNMNSTIYHCTIHSNPSTGYHWEPVVDSKYFKYLGSDFKSENSSLVGSPGYQTFSFQALTSDTPTVMEFNLIAPDGSIVDNAYVNINNI